MENEMPSVVTRFVQSPYPFSQQRPLLVDCGICLVLLCWRNSTQGLLDELYLAPIVDYFKICSKHPFIDPVLYVLSLKTNPKIGCGGTHL